MEDQQDEVEDMESTTLTYLRTMSMIHQEHSQTWLIEHKLIIIDRFILSCLVPFCDRSLMYAL